MEEDGGMLAIVLCTYNGQAWLPALLESISCQTLLPDVMIIRDDKSTDGSLDILVEFARVAPFEVQLCVNGQRAGSTKNFEAGLAAAQHCEMIALCDQDDLWYPDKLARLVVALKAAPLGMLAFCDADVVDAQCRPLGYSAWDSRRVHDQEQELKDPSRALLALVRHSSVSGATCLIRASLLRVALPFPASVRNAEVPHLLHDRWLSIVAAGTGRVVPLPVRLMGYRIHPDQQVGLAAPETKGGGSRAEMERLRLERIALIKLELASRGVAGRRLRGLRAEERYLRLRLRWKWLEYRSADRLAMLLTGAAFARRRPRCSRLGCGGPRRIRVGAAVRR